jgi:hypothetical protein
MSIRDGWQIPRAAQLAQHKDLSIGRVSARRTVRDEGT